LQNHRGFPILQGFLQKQKERFTILSTVPEKIASARGCTQKCDGFSPSPGGVVFVAQSCFQLSPGVSAETKREVHNPLNCMSKQSICKALYAEVRRQRRRLGAWFSLHNHVFNFLQGFVQKQKERFTILSTVPEKIASARGCTRNVDGLEAVAWGRGILAESSWFPHPSRVSAETKREVYGPLI
jgi:hypothetical protein